MRPKTSIHFLHWPFGTHRIKLWLLLWIILYLTFFFSISECGVVGLTRFMRKRFADSWWKSNSAIQSSAGSQKKQIHKKATDKRYSNLNSNISDSNPFVCDHLCMDMNQLLHVSFRVQSDPRHFMAKLFGGIDSILRNVVPSKTLVLAFDGPAPFAKMQTQRSRRKASPESSLITPGTDFMSNIENIMICYTLQRIQRHNFRNLTVFISGPENPGEGELKIINWINNHMPTFNDTIVICGSDSDILLQAVTLVKVPNAIVLQTGFEYVEAFCNVSALVKSLAITTGLLDDDKALSQDTSNTNNPSSSNKKNLKKGHVFLDSSHDNSTQNMLMDKIDSLPHTLRFDLAVLFYLQGNDYLPKLRGVTMISTLAAYGTVMKRLPVNQRFLLDVKNNSFNFLALWLLMAELRKGKLRVPLPMQLPTALQGLQKIAQKNKLPEIIWNDTSVENPASRSIAWTATLTFNDTIFSTPNSYSSKKMARKVVSEVALRELDPDAYQMMLDKHVEVRQKLEKLRVDAMNQDSLNFENSLSGDPAQETSNKNMNDDATLGLIIGNEELDEEEDILDGDDENDDEEDEDEENKGINYKLDGKKHGYSEAGSAVSEYEYAKYVKTTDIQSYLQGLLWVMQMYLDGQCPDLSFTYAGRPPISPLLIMRFIEMSYLKARSDSSDNPPNNGKLVSLDDLQDSKFGIIDEGTGAALLRSLICVPTSDAKQLSAGATCISVVPEEARVYVPSRLSKVWAELQQSFFRQRDDEARAPTYDELVKSLELIWHKCSPSSDAVSSVDASNVEKKKLIAAAMDEGRRRNQRRPSRSLRKMSGIVERIESFSNFGMNQKRRTDEIIKSPLISNEEINDKAIHSNEMDANDLNNSEQTQDIDEGGNKGNSEGERGNKERGRESVDSSVIGDGCGGRRRRGRWEDPN